MNRPVAASKFLFLNAFFLVISACVSKPPSLGANLDFAVNGRVSVKQGDEGFAASYRWQQAGEAFSIDVWGPFGQGHVFLLGNAQEIAIKDSRGDMFDGGDPEAVMMRHLGWSLPLEALPSWVQGKPAEAFSAKALRHDEPGDLIEFHQLGWNVVCSRYSSISGRRVPGRLTAVKDGSKVVLVLKRWRF